MEQKRRLWFFGRKKEAEEPEELNIVAETPVEAEPEKDPYEILEAPDIKEKQAWIRKTLFAHFGVPQYLKLVLYAPAFREGMTAEDLDIDINMLCRKLSEKYGGEFGAILYFPEECTELKEKMKNPFVKGISPDTEYEYLKTLYGSEYIDLTVKGNERYYYGVTALRTEDAAEHFRETEAAEGEADPEMPVITSLKPGMNGVELKWSPVSGAAKYELYRQTKTTPEWEDSPWEMRRVMLSDFTKCLDVSAKNGKESRYRIVAVDSEGRRGKYDPVGLEIYFNRPLIFDIRKTEEGQFVIWKPDRRADTYEVYRTPASFVKDISDYPDLAELLLAADVLVGDYGEWMEKYAKLNRPAFLYVPDLDRYISRENKKPEAAELFPCCEDNEDLRMAVENET